ncbi:DNA-binding domain-containing protein [Lysobacter sp. D1-1-M9]|uniref:DNA-binding domain-containing protein n=1 Tax=Novilysobacter longmucuonensis TaxID=3098603 RepID=UPI002FCB493C
MNNPQRAFAAALLDPQPLVPPGLRVAEGVDAARRFAVHRNNISSALTDALAAGFPVTRALVGEAFFRAMARARIVRDPPRSPVLGEYGAGFAEFIEGFAPAASVPYLADIARLECLRVQAFHAADATALDSNAFAALLADPARLTATRLRLHPAARWLCSPHAVRSIWNAHQHLEDTADADLSVLDPTRAEAVLVARPQLRVVTVPLPPGGADLLDALSTGHTLGDAAAAASTRHPTAQLSTLLALIVEYGLAIALDPPLEH